MMNKITRNIFVGDANYTKTGLERKGIGYVINVGGKKTGLEDFTWHLNDGPNPVDNYYHVLKELDEVVRNDSTVLVHCRGGFSRSPFIVALYLVYRHGVSIDNAISMMKKFHPITNIQPDMVRCFKEATKK